MGSIAAAGPVAARPASQGVAAVPSSDLRLLDLSGIRRLFDGIERQRNSLNEGARAAAWAEFSLLAESVVGDEQVGALTFDDLRGPGTDTRGPLVRASAGMRARDRSAYQLLGLGYSARETADVVSGRISVAALDNALKMMMVGLGKEAAANYLDSQYTRVAALREPARPPLDPDPPTRNSIDAAIEKYAGLHGVDPVIVRAIVAVESAFDVGARSKAGAIGLMQLLPGTARALGVDPLIPEQNIAGGVRYLSALLEMFGGLELALVAYNGGPEFARRYAKGQAALYGETREYVKQVLSRIPGTNQPRAPALDIR